MLDELDSRKEHLSSITTIIEELIKEKDKITGLVVAFEVEDTDKDAKLGSTVTQQFFVGGYARSLGLAHMLKNNISKADYSGAPS